VRLLDNILQGRQQFLNGIHVSRQVKCQMKMMIAQGTRKTTEHVETIQELNSEGRHRTIHELADTTGISYEVFQILTENLNVHLTTSKFVPDS
jgi:hypothetical protein